jgi:TolA-binding protein
MKPGIGLHAIIVAILSGGPGLAIASESASKPAMIHDMAALTIQSRGIAKLKKLLKHYKGTRQEADLLHRLGDLYLESSGISFRISEGISIKNKSPLYTDALKNGVQSLSELIAKYPYHGYSPIAHFKRGKAYRELGLTALAKADYLYLVQNQPQFEYLDSALMDLADFAQDANQHQDALGYLAQIEKMHDSDFYPIALHKSAWSHFNLTQYQAAIDQLKKETEFYFSKIEGKKEETTAETAFLESAFNDLALFNFEAINKKQDFANVDQALVTFKSIDKNGGYFGSVVLKFAKLLKAYTLTSDLEQLKNQLIKKHHDLPETAEVALLLYQYHFEKRNWGQISPLIGELKGLRNEKIQPKMEQILTSSLNDLHKLVIKNKRATERGVLVRPLITLTESVEELFGRDNSTSLLSKYSLAETLFELGEYGEAAKRYSELMKLEYAQALESKKLSVPTITLRWLSARYRELKKQDLIPEKLKVQALNANPEPATKEQLQGMLEWVSVIAGADFRKASTEAQNSLRAYLLESYKIGYLYFDREAAIQNLVQFGMKRSETEEGTLAISIALDTLSQSEDWPRLFDLTQKVKSLKFKSKTLPAAIADMSASAHLKITLKTQDPAEALKRTEECAKKFAGTKIKVECEIIHAKTLISMNETVRAEKELGRLIEMKLEGQKHQSLILLRADARRKLGKMNESIQDLERYQALTQYQDVEITKQILEYSWLKTDQNRLTQLLGNKAVCTGKNAPACEQYRLIRLLDQGQEGSVPYATSFRNTLKAEKEVQAIWTLIAMRNPKKLAFQDRLVLVQRLSHSWEFLNPNLQIHLVPKLISRTGETLESIRISAPGIAPLTADQSSIERRMRLMQELDLAFSKTMKLNWIDLKRKAIVELALIYERLVSDLKGINTPEDLMKPFHTKVTEMKSAMDQMDQLSVILKAPSTDALLLANEVKASLPDSIWAEWKKGVELKQRDYLLHLVSAYEQNEIGAKGIAPILKGLVLLLSDTPSEAFALIESAPDSPWKTNLSQFFQRRKL